MRRFDSESDFHDHIIDGLARLDQGQEGINSRLDKINGSVKHLYERVEGAEKSVLEHQLNCPMNEKVDELQRSLSEGDHPGSMEVRRQLEEFNKMAEASRAGKQISKQWLEHLRPIITFIVSGLLVLLLLHGNDLLKALVGRG